MNIAKPFTFVANTHAKASEVNANFDTVYSQVNSNISAIAQNATDIENLENNKADINGNTTQRFAVADAITDGDAINKRSLRNAIGNSIDYISGFTITKDSGSPNNTIIVSEGSCYDSTKAVVLSKANSSTKTNDSQAANATYYVYIIGSSSGSQTDILISPNQVTPTLPTGYALYRQIGSYTTDGDNKISSIYCYGLDMNVDHSGQAALSYNAPDWANKATRILSTTYIAQSNGWVVGYSSSSSWNYNLTCTINNVVQYDQTIHGLAGGVRNASFFLPISTGDSYVITSAEGAGASGAYYFVPVKGV